MKGRGSIGPRLGMTVAAAVTACVAMAPDRSVEAQRPRALPGPVDYVYADPANLMYHVRPL